MNCSDIHRLLKNYQEDLLVEEEYQAFIAHLDQCPKCKEFVRSVGFLSHQLWELGNVRPPSDLAGTILYRLKQHKAADPVAPRSGLFLAAVKITLGVLAVVLITGTMAFLAIRAWHRSDEPQETAYTEDELFVTEPATPEPTARAPRRDREPGTQEVVLYDYMTDVSEPRGKDNAPAVTDLHWHLALSPQGAGGRRKALAAIDDALQQRSAEAAQLAVDIKDIEREAAPGFREHYSLEDAREADGRTEERARALQAKRDQRKMLETEIRRLRKEKEDLLRQQRQDAFQQQRRKEMCRAEFLKALNASGTGLDYDGANVLVFTGAGRTIERIYEQVRMMDADVCALQDFTEYVDVRPQTETRVSVYLTDDDPGIRHWHVTHAASFTRAGVLDVIRELGGQVRHTSRENIVFSIHAAKLEELRRRLEAKRLSLSEYGGTKSDSDALISKPVTISVYYAD